MTARCVTQTSIVPCTITVLAVVYSDSNLQHQTFNTVAGHLHLLVWTFKELQTVLAVLTYLALLLQMSHAQSDKLCMSHKQIYCF